MKIWEITHMMGDIVMVERVEADTQMEARGVLVRHHLKQLLLLSIVEIKQ